MMRAVLPWVVLHNLLLLQLCLWWRRDSQIENHCQRGNSALGPDHAWFLQKRLWLIAIAC